MDCAGAKVIILLEDRGLRTTAVQLPLTSLDEDVATVRRALASENGSILLVGHSYGGAVITEAGIDPKVLSLGTHPQFHDLSPFQEPSSFEDRRHCLLDPRGPRSRLLRAGEVKQVSPLPTRRQRLEGALEPPIVAELLLQLLGHGKLWGLRLTLIPAFSAATASRT